MNSITKILILEHDKNDLELIQYELRKAEFDYVFETVQNEKEYISALKNFSPDIILSDYSLPSFDGPAAFKLRNKLAPNIPFIYVSGTIGEENSIELIKNGVTDFALKDKLFTLNIKIKRALKESREKQQKYKTEEELILSEKRMARAQEIAHMGSWELDFATQIGLWSNEACRIYGIPKDQNQQSFETWLSFIHHDDLNFIRNNIKKSRKSLEDFSLFHRIVLKNGNIRHIYAEFIFECDIAGNSTGMYGIVQDVTEKKLAEKYLKQSESRLKEAQAVSNTSNWEIDFETNIHYWSDEFYKIFQVNKESAVPSTELFLSFIHPDSLDFANNNINDSFSSLKGSNFSFKFVRKDGKTRHGYTEWRFEFDKNNNPIRLYGILQDITERKIAELKLEEQNKELIKTNSELDRFVYSVSHDLRSPLTSVLGLLSFIDEESKEPEILKYAKMIRISINRLDGFIRNILNYSRNNRTNLEIELIPLEQTIQDIITSLQNMEDSEGIIFEVNIDENQSFYSDLHHFIIVLENLIANAIKYHKEEKSGRFIKITGKAGKNHLNLVIKDNGIGISPVHHDKIFDMFYRLAGRVSGSGIGLYIVKEIIEKLQGTINVLSQEGNGTSFNLRIKNMTPKTYSLLSKELPVKQETC